MIVDEAHGMSKSAVHSSVSKVKELLNDLYFDEVFVWSKSQEDREAKLSSLINIVFLRFVGRSKGHWSKFSLRLRTTISSLIGN